ncbi:hypothetical protein [Mammaliicoccus sp. D-M17]|uniref:hypothetical protein n=1 Tax=Mammaliicoccus sp. D-M17 TaxID=2898677 RepID=UPI001EFAF8EE|nr:hypothetical protein [Mammaliicoccus sp. D-M17]
MFDDLVGFIGSLFFWLGNAVMGVTLIIGLIFAILLGVEAKFGILDTSANTIVSWSKKLGLFAVIGIAIGIVCYTLGLIITPNHLSVE